MNTKFYLENVKVKRPLGRSVHGWEDNIETDLTETGCDGVDWIHLALNRNKW
jgi:hypothetical protein